MFSPESLRELVLKHGYAYFEVVDQPQVIDDFIYRSPVVAIASRYPIINTTSISPNKELGQQIGLTADFTFSRKILRATVNVPHIGNTDCYVVHFKSKRAMIDVDEQNPDLSGEQNIIETLKAQVAGGWGSTIQRGSEAALLFIEMVARREKTGYPMMLMGDFNNTLCDGVLSHLVTNDLRFVSPFDRDAYLAKYCLYDAWELYQTIIRNETANTSISAAVESVENTDPEEGAAREESTEMEDCADTREIEESPERSKSVRGAKNTEDNEITDNSVLRPPTHYYDGKGSVLDYILLSCEFDAGYHGSLYQVSAYDVYDRHLIDPIFDRDGQSTDHAIALVTLTLRA